jgi:hypothetical protein
VSVDQRGQLTMLPIALEIALVKTVRSRDCLVARRKAVTESGGEQDDARQFAEALLGREITKVPHAGAGTISRDLLEWLADISPEHELRLKDVLREEAEAKKHEERSDALMDFVAAIEGTWDASKHPRGAFSQNRGWFSPTAGAGPSSGASSEIGRFDQALGPSHPQARALAGSLAPHSTAQLRNAQRTPSDMLNQLAQTSSNSDQGASDETPHEPLTQSDLLTYFHFLYGDKGRRLLNAFLRSGGRITVEGLWFGNSSLTTRNHWGPHQIRVDQGLNPAEAARELMERLIESTGLTEVRYQLDHSGFPNIETLITSYKQSVKKAASFVSLASQLYLSGITIASEGADWVVTISELSDGNYQAAIGLLPLLPAVVGKTGIVLKHGRQSLRISADAARRIKGIPVHDLIELLESTRKLARNMEKAGIVRPAGTAAHHIVPAGLEKFHSAVEARAILKRFHIDVHNAANGVYLPSKFDDALRAAYHRGVRTQLYFDEILRRLKFAQTAEDALLVLNQIRRELLLGTFPV